MTEHSISVIMCDDHVVVLAGLERLVSTFADINVIGTASNGPDAVALAKEHKPDVVLMDLQMPGMDGVETTQRILEVSPSSSVVTLTSFSDRARIQNETVTDCASLLHPALFHTALFGRNRFHSAERLTFVSACTSPPSGVKQKFGVCTSCGRQMLSVGFDVDARGIRLRTKISPKSKSTWSVVLLQDRRIMWKGSVRRGEFHRRLSNSPAQNSCRFDSPIATAPCAPRRPQSRVDF